MVGDACGEKLVNDEKRGRSELARRAELEWINNLHSVYCCCARPGAGLSGSSAVHSVQLLQSADHQIISRYLLPEIERSPSPSVTATVATMEIEVVKFVFIPTQVTENIANSRAWPRPGQYHPGREA